MKRLIIMMLLFISSVLCYGVPMSPRLYNMHKQVISTNITGLNLFSHLTNKSDNIVISPYSINQAMSMVLVGADGQTRSEMATVMRQTMNDGLLSDSVFNVNDLMKKFADREKIILESANALCLTGRGVSNSYTKLLKDKYLAEIFYGRNVAPINEWVSKKTKGKIPDVLPKLSPNSVCVLLNAIYFKGNWDAKFNKRLTIKSDFYSSDGKKKKVKMMRKSAKFATKYGKDYEAISIPFKGGVINFTLLMPKEGTTLDQLVKNLDSSMVSNLLKELKASSKQDKIDLQLPRFKIEYSSSLINAFKSLGMQKAFSSRSANFAKLTGKPNRLGLFWISQINHKAYLRITEKGGEAAAATAVEIRTKRIQKNRSFKVDRPFIFFISDSSLNLLLFIGRVNKM